MERLVFRVSRGNAVLHMHILDKREMGVLRAGASCCAFAHLFVGRHRVPCWTDIPGAQDQPELAPKVVFMLVYIGMCTPATRGPSVSKGVVLSVAGRTVRPRLQAVLQVVRADVIQPPKYLSQFPAVRAKPM